MQEQMDQVCKLILKSVLPSSSERKRIEALAKRLERRVASTAEGFGVDAEVRLEGSVAKDTWLSEEPDIDIFMRVSPTVPRKSLGDACLKVARKATAGSAQVERFADHPYLEAIVEKTRVNIVPCYKVERGAWLSATDRTPFHTEYINERLNNELRDNVRLLKKFMKGIGVYGAEIKVGGFSGYLCELMVLNYGGFAETLEAFAHCKEKIIIDLEGYYKNRETDLQLFFEEPLVVVDPVDKVRNVASAVRRQRLCTLIAASQALLKNPSRGFFYPPKTVPLTTGKLRQELKRRGSALVFVTFGKVDAVPDILWGQLYKSQRSLRKLLEANDFKVLQECAWSDEKGLNIFAFELEDCCVSPVKLHLGPPLDKEKECEKFIAKHAGKQGTICGPYVEDGRWVVLVNRKYTDACTLLREKLKDGGRNAGVAEGISQVLKKSLKVLVNEEIVKVHGKNSEFAGFLTDFLVGKPKWLEAS